MADNVSKAERSRIMAAVKGKDTRPELAVRRMLHALGYRFRLHQRSLPGCPDIVFASRRKVINVHGCFWHMHSCGRCRIPAVRRKYWLTKLRRNRARDTVKAQKLRRAGWSVFVVWECQIARPSLALRLTRFLGPRKPAPRE